MEKERRGEELGEQRIRDTYASKRSVRSRGRDRKKARHVRQEYSLPQECCCLARLEMFVLGYLGRFGATGCKQHHLSLHLGEDFYIARAIPRPVHSDDLNTRAEQLWIFPAPR